MSKIKYQSLTGMHDVLPEDQVYFKKIQKAVESVSNYYNFEKIETPILEFAEVFQKAVGNDTDIVGKEMYTFRTRGGDVVSLRPEGTAAVMRSYLEHGMHNLPQPVNFGTQVHFSDMKGLRQEDSANFISLDLKQ